jgi:hypothetical protein
MPTNFRSGSPELLRGRQGWSLTSFFVALTNCLAALQGDVIEKAKTLLRVLKLHRQDVAKYSFEHRPKCPEITRVAHAQAVSPNPRNFVSQLVVLGLYCGLMSSRRRLCSRSGAPICHQSVYRVADVGQKHA